LRGAETGPAKGPFYAMILHSAEPLLPFAEDGPVLYRSGLRNWPSGKFVESRQSVAVVRTGEPERDYAGYPVLFTATLVDFVQLTDPV
jgi:hypothetical protein